MASLSLLVSKAGQPVAVYSTVWTSVIWWHHPMFYSNWYSNLYLFLYIHSRACLRSLKPTEPTAVIAVTPKFIQRWPQTAWAVPAVQMKPSFACPARLRAPCCHQVPRREQGRSARRAGLARPLRGQRHPLRHCTAAQTPAPIWALFRDHWHFLKKLG